MKNIFSKFIIFLLVILLCSCTLSNEIYLVRFRNTDNSIIAMYAVGYGETVTCPVSPTQEGADFLNWFEDIELTKEFDFGTKIKKETNIYAGWKKYTCNVSFVTNIDKTLENQVIEYNETVTEPELEKPSNCYLFEGWYTDLECTKKYDFKNRVSSNLTLYAKWNINHTISNFDIIKKPTCIEDGKKEGLCSVCNYKIKETIVATGHNYNGIKCSKCGGYSVTLANVGTSITDTVKTDGLKLTLNSLIHTEVDGYNIYSINYTLLNEIPGSEKKPGIFKIIYKTESGYDSSFQTGFFNNLFYNDVNTRDYTWKLTSDKTFVCIEYIPDSLMSAYIFNSDVTDDLLNFIPIE